LIFLHCEQCTLKELRKISVLHLSVWFFCIKPNAHAYRLLFLKELAVFFAALLR